MSAAITSTETHPHCTEILGVLAQTVHLDDDEVRRLALAWKDSPDRARARDKALRPETPLILEVLASFEGIADLFADDLAGDADYVTVPAPVTALALKAVRDAIAAAYARPVLADAEYRLLTEAWREVFPVRARLVPDFGPQHEEIVHLLTVVPRLGCHAHDPASRALWRDVLGHAATLDRSRHGAAVDAAWHAAVLSGRRRLWGLLNRSCQESYHRGCAECARTATDDDLLVLTLCLGAAAGLLVQDLLDDDSVAVLVDPATVLLPPAV